MPRGTDGRHGLEEHRRVTPSPGSLLDENLLPLLLHRRQEGDHEEDQGHRKKPGADRTLDEGGELAPRDDQGTPQILLHETAEHEAEKQRRGLEAELDERVADKAEE